MGKKTPKGTPPNDLNSIAKRIQELTGEHQRDQQVISQLDAERERIAKNALARQGGIIELRKYLPAPVPPKMPNSKKTKKAAKKKKPKKKKR